MKITLCIDKQSRDNPSSELRQYLIDIGCPLRSYEGVFDELKISTNDTNNLIGVIIRRCYVDKYGVLKKLEAEEIQELEIPEIMLFEGTNYVYIKDFTNLNMKIEYLTNAEMNKYFATKAEMNSSIRQTYDSILLTVSTKADKTELQTAISLLTDEIDLRVIKDKIISAINMSPETITILANRLGLTANDVLDIIAGNEINLTSKNITIVSDKFKVDRFGQATFEKATLKNVYINGGYISLSDIEGVANSQIEIMGGDGAYFEARSDRNRLYSPTKITSEQSYISNNVANAENGAYIASTTWQSPKGSTYIRNGTITTGVVEQTSLESKKKNFESFNKGLELITSSDFYLYNLKTENDDDKKHIGLVIGDKYNTPTEFINQKEDAIDLYSLISACGDAIKTLNNKVIELEEKTKEMR